MRHLLTLSLVVMAVLCGGYLALPADAMTPQRRVLLVSSGLGAGLGANCLLAQGGAALLATAGSCIKVR